MFPKLLTPALQEGKLASTGWKAGLRNILLSTQEKADPGLFKKSFAGAGEMAWWLRALDALSENPDWTPSSNHYPVPEGPMPSSCLFRHVVSK